MADTVHFVPKHQLDVEANILSFIQLCRYQLAVFGADLDWENNYWKNAGISFGNLEQKTRILDPAKVMRQPFRDFGKGYFRYQQGHNPTGTKNEIRALRCVERALVEKGTNVGVQNISIDVLDRAAVLARTHFKAGMAYHTGREIERLAKFLTERNLTSSVLDWKSPITRPDDTVRTGKKAQENRQKKLPEMEAIHALAEIFSQEPVDPRDIFVTSTAALLLCAPSRVTEILALSIDCEVWETNRKGESKYGWRFQPGKGAAPMTKWIPDVMMSLAREAISRIRKMTFEARCIAYWLENKHDQFYRHATCPDVDENKPLTIEETAAALGIGAKYIPEIQVQLKQFGLPDCDGMNTLASLNSWVHSHLPESFPWFDIKRGVRFSDALFCMQDNQLRSGVPTSALVVWKPTNNIFNFDLGPRETSPGYFPPTIFDRHGFNKGRGNPLKLTSNHFRHLLNTMAQRGGMSQSEIARWSGRVDVKQNRVYDHMTEFELSDMLRSHSAELMLGESLEEIRLRISELIPITPQEFNTLVIPMAHVTEFGFCIHDFVMSPCQRFRDCVNCTEQICIKGDHRLSRIRVRHEQVKVLLSKAEKEIADGTAGADRWFEVHSHTHKRLAELIEILENPTVCNGAIIRLRNENEFSPLRRAVEAKATSGRLKINEKPLLEIVYRQVRGEDG